MKVIFMGTPEFSVGTLEALIDAGHEIVLVVTQPDKPKGRGKEVTVTPVKAVAMKHDIPVFQPVKVRDPVALLEIEKYPADVMVVVAFGQILPKQILEMTKYGCINVHASLLPAYRGAAPIQWAIINGETKTGITTMQMDEGLDTGDMILKEEVVITSEETGASLHDKLATLGASLCVKTLRAIEKGSVTFEKQEDTTTEYAWMLKKEMGRVDWSKSAVEIERLIRGLNSWPGAYSLWGSKELKIWKGKAAQGLMAKKEEADREQSVDREERESIVETSEANRRKPVVGEIVKVDKKTVMIQTGEGYLQVIEIQVPGKKRMTVEEFLKGNKLVEGTILL